MSYTSIAESQHRTTQRYSLEDIELNTQPQAFKRFDDITPSINTPQQYRQSDDKPIAAFAVKESTPINYFNADSKHPVYLDQEQSYNYDQIPEEKKQFITKDNYNIAVSHMLQYTDKSKAIDLIQTLINRSNSSYAFDTDREKYVGIYEAPNEAYEHLILKISEAYDDLKADGKGKDFISFGEYFLAMHSFVWKKCLSRIDAINLMQSIISSSDNIEDFNIQLTLQKNTHTTHNNNLLHYTYTKLKNDKKNILIDINDLKKEIQKICNYTFISFQEACDKILEFANKSYDTNDLQMFIHIFLNEAKISKGYEIISVEDLANSPDISFSKMYNYTQTCWFNALCKYVLPVVEKNNDITQLLNIAITNCNTRTTQGIYAKFVLQSLQSIFMDLQDNKPVNTKIGYFFRAVDMYNKKVTEAPVDDTQHNAIKSIFSFVADGFNGVEPPNYSKIKSQDPEKFYLDLCGLIGISDASHTIFTTKRREYHITILELIQYDIILDQDLIFSTRVEQRDQSSIYQIPDNTATEDSETLENLNDLLDRAENIPKHTLTSIKKQLSPIKNQLQQIETTVTQTEKYSADIGQLNQLMVRTSVYYYNRESNQLAINVNQTATVIHNIFPEFTMPITDEKTQDLYNIKFQPVSILMRRGNGISGHYFTISVRSIDNKLFIHDDSLNVSLESALIKKHRDSNDQTFTDFASLSPKDQLLAYIQQENVYPVNIRYAVDSKDKQ